MDMSVKCPICGAEVDAIIEVNGKKYVLPEAYLDVDFMEMMLNSDYRDVVVPMNGEPFDIMNACDITALNPTLRIKSVTLRGVDKPIDVKQTPKTKADWRSRGMATAEAYDVETGFTYHVNANVTFRTGILMMTATAGVDTVTVEVNLHRDVGFKIIRTHKEG